MVLVIAGSIAAYKAVYVARLLLQRGARVIPVMTAAAKSFVGVTTFSGLTGERVYDDMFEPTASGEPHVELTSQADVVAMVPATADLMARMATGRSDDLASAIALCARCPVVVAPAMHPRMWSHSATQRNASLLRETRDIRFVDPVDGVVASGESGVGRMAEPETIADTVFSCLSPRDLQGKHIVVTAGPTVEDIDPVRFVSNRSSGKMGFAIATEAARRGATVSLVAGPVALETPAGVDRTNVRSALSMQEQLCKLLGPELAGADAVVMAAAVGDYRVEHPSPAKLKRSDATLTLSLVPNPDILASLGESRRANRPLLVGFALETNDVEVHARKNLSSKHVDLVVANEASESLGRDTNAVLLVDSTTSRSVGPALKTEIARILVDEIARRLQSP